MIYHQNLQKVWISELVVLGSWNLDWSLPLWVISRIRAVVELPYFFKRYTYKRCGIANWVEQGEGIFAMRLTRLVNTPGLLNAVLSIHSLITSPYCWSQVVYAILSFAQKGLLQKFAIFHFFKIEEKKKKIFLSN